MHKKPAEVTKSVAANEFSRDSIRREAASRPSVLPELRKRAEQGLQICIQRGWNITAGAWRETIALIDSFLLVADS